MGREYTELAQAIDDWECGLEFLTKPSFATDPRLADRVCTRAAENNLRMLGLHVLCFIDRGSVPLGYYSIRRKQPIVLDS
jgi:hypothetical protein